QRYRDNSNAACSNCGALPTPMPAAPVTPGMIPMPVPDVPWYRQHAAAVPDIGQQLDDAIRARSNGRVGNFWAAPTPAPVAPPCPRVLLHFDAPATLDMVVARQRQTGLRPPDPHAPLHTMDATRCERCHRQSCNCPPK